MSKIKNILIFVVIAAALVLVYIFFIQPALSNQNQASLVSSTSTDNTGAVDTTNATDTNSSVNGDFLSTLLNINTIQLNDKIFDDPAFNSLHDSTITLIPDATSGRPNPFAQFGSENVVTPPVTTATTPSTTSTTKTSTSSTTKKTTTTPKTTTSSTTSTGTNGTVVKP